MEEKIRVAVMGLPKKDVWTIAEAITKSKDLELVPISLTDSNATVESIVVGGVLVRLLTEEHRQAMLNVYSTDVDVFVDCMAPARTKKNIKFYNEQKKPFIVETTLSTARLIREDANFQAMRTLMDLNPELEKDYNFKVKESRHGISFIFARKNSNGKTLKTVKEDAFQTIKDFILATPELRKRYAVKITEGKWGISFAFTRKVIGETLKAIRAFSKKEADHGNSSFNRSAFNANLLHKYYDFSILNQKK